MFREAVHNQVLQILHCLNAELLEDCRAYFGGGTQIVMSLGEYRLSRDIDFLCPYGPDYSRLRRAIFEQGYRALFAQQQGLVLPGAIRADQYGIRFPVQINSTTIKFEIVAEGRIAFDPPQRYGWCPVVCLGQVDQVAEKLLANSDRWQDRSVWSRDLIDLAMLRLALVAPLPQAAVTKAEAAYPVRVPLERAVQQFQQDSDYQQRCFNALQIQDRQRVIEGMTLLEADLN